MPRDAARGCARTSIKAHAPGAPLEPAPVAVPRPLSAAPAPAPIQRRVENSESESCDTCMCMYEARARSAACASGSVCGAVTSRRGVRRGRTAAPSAPCVSKSHRYRIVVNVFTHAD